MKLIDIIRNVKRTDNPSPSSWDYADLTQIMNEFDIYDYLDSANTRITVSFYEKRLCTDSHVGGRVYFLDDDVIAISYQTGRKSSETFKWVSKEDFEKTHQYLLSLVNDTSEIPFTLLVDEDYEVEMDEGHYVEFAGGILADELILKNDNSRVKLIDRLTKVYGTTSQYVKIKLASGDEQIVSTKEVLVPYLIQVD